ncbi:MAG: Na/Pi cotransporter family protein [Bryobacterales bacterium]|nr:Na/Pi cotransporter family protein [Bryobacterales bacterium]
MVLLTDGMKAFAGDALRRYLVRFTGTPRNAFVSGALATALVQSSSATTVTMIGFVSAGLLTFSQAVGVMMGASLGTTSTGWIVSVLGLKGGVGYYAMPLIGAGVFLRLLGPPRWRPLGLAAAGFGLIFVGIGTLQEAMRALSGVFQLSNLPSGGFLGHLVTMFIGIAMTVMLQSSSAAVATTLTALHTESINFDQAATLVIGASIGTTVTGALASIGASVSAKRTALALVLFNSATGFIAIVLLPVLLLAIEWAQRHLALDAGARSLAAFHTGFIALGVAVFLPFVDRFAAWVRRLLPDKGPALTAHLDATLLNVPAVALEATRRSLRETAAELFGAAAGTMGQELDPSRRARIDKAVNQLQDFFSRIPAEAQEQGASELRVSLLHAVDHIVRLQGHLDPHPSVREVIGHEFLRMPLAECRELLSRAAAGLRGLDSGRWIEEVERRSQALAESNQRHRPALLTQTATGAWKPQEALDLLDALRWLNTVAYHAWRISAHLSEQPAGGA